MGIDHWKGSKTKTDRWDTLHVQKDLYGKQRAQSPSVRWQHRKEKEKDQTDDIAAPIQRDLQTGSQQDKPKPEDFNLPSSQEEWKELVDKMVALGLSTKEANASLEKRRKMYNTALKEFSNNATRKEGQSPGKTA